MLLKKLLFGLFLFTGLGFVFKPKVALTKWAICENSNLVVKGSTNMSTFSCAIPSYPKLDTIIITQSKDAKNIPLLGKMKLDIKSFDCKNRWMTSELRKTLKEKQFPMLNIQFISLNEFPDLTKKSNAKGVVDIEIAGARKRYEVTYQIVSDNNGNIQLSTTKDVNFSDFNIIPPMKMGKLVQTKDRLSVVLNLSLKVVD